ncbi:GNAT family N-acetyltransferase [Zobellia laminariae]|uniref:GNAT family N-acetyltransferase n=1 Tax=Zobellia laminariae TaxID=248906 RepID=UPI0026F4496A|nr:GNAT family N-acetyltransferase [Zobellia laminariae]WKX75630.1 GNAT family N-acetyltransferase [Zobellia laminariae]
MTRRDYTNIPLVNKKGDKGRFEIEIDGQIAFMEYMISKKDIIYLTHTEVPTSLEGQGVGSALVSKVFQFIADSGMKMAPLCPFVAAYIKRHPEAGKAILAEGYFID